MSEGVMPSVASLSGRKLLPALLDFSPGGNVPPTPLPAPRGCVPATPLNLQTRSAVIAAP